jgi:hypothetical protein
MNILSALILSLSILFGATPATPVDEPQTVSQVGEYAVSDTEATVLETDAEATWTDYMATPQVGEDVAYTYVGSYDYEPDELPSHMIVIQSLDLDRTWHVYEAQLLSHA